MDGYNVMVTQANSKLGLEFVRQLVFLPHPPDYIFAAYTSNNSLKDLIGIEESSKKSKVIIIKMDFKLPNGVVEARTTIEKAIGNRGLDFLINVICYTNNEKDTISKSLENQFETYTLAQVLFFKVMLPLLQAASVQYVEHSQESSAIFLNITEDNSAGRDSGFEINKVALHLSMGVMADKVQQDRVLLLTTCLKTEETAHDKYQSELENTVTTILLHVFCSSQIKRSGTKSF